MNMTLPIPADSQVSAETIGKLCKSYGIPKINVRSYYSFDNSLINSLSETVCRYHRIVPMEMLGDEQLLIAMSNPFDIIARNIISQKTGLRLKINYCPDDDIDYAISRLFKTDTKLEDALQDLVEIDETVEDSTNAEISIDILRSEATDAPAVVFINTLLVQAIQERASDIHIEPQEENLRIRLRIDGILKELPLTTKRLQDGVITRVKILAGMDIAERRVPQDGRIKFRIMGRSVDVRVSSIPGIYGEKIVLRILDRGSTSLNINDLGVSQDLLTRLKTIANSAHGMILATGPTGSGKTTTLYSILNYVNSPDLNIVTAEDPVEYRISGINQIQVKSQVGLTFASALRSFLRQDPDIIMIGEIRDLETAEIAIKAALTGHLVLSTLHTNDATSTLTRLINMGVDRYLIQSSVSVVIAQRLVRRICLNCKRPVDLPQNLKTHPQLVEMDLSQTRFYRGKGCKQCSGTGFWGRVAIHEVLFLTPRLKEMISQDRTEQELNAAAVKEGMETLLMNGLQKAQRGITSLEEVLRVV